MNASRRLLAALALATALLVPAAAAQAAAPGINVTALDDDGDPHGRRRQHRRRRLGRRERRCRSCAVVSWDTLTGGTREFEITKFTAFADKASARGLRVLLTRHRRDRVAVASPAQYAARRRPTSRPSSGASDVDYEVWNEPDDTTFWPNGPQPGRLRGAAQGRLPGDQGRRPGRDGARRRPRRQRLRVRRGALRQRRQGLLRRRRRPHRHGLPDDRPARVLPRAERAHRPLLLHGLPRGPRDDARPRRRQARLDDRARAGRRCRRTCERGGRAGTKVGRRQPGRAGRLPHEGLRLPGQRPLRRAGRLVQPRTTSRRARPTTRSTSA